MNEWAATGCQQLLYEIPEGSGICRAVGVSPERYDVGFVSIAGGSYKQQNESGNWYATHQQFELAKVEARISSECIYEYSRFDQASPFLNCYKLPTELNEAIYQDRDLPAECFEKSLIVKETAEHYLPNQSFSGVFFPSRRGDGGILVFDRNQVSVSTIYTGHSPPSYEQLGDQGGRFNQPTTGTLD